MSVQLRAARYIALSWFGAVACGQVLGIEDARVDPSLTIGSAAGGTSNAGAGNGVGGNDTSSRGGALTAGGSSSAGADSGGTSGGLGPGNEGGADSGEGGSDPGAGGAPIGDAGAAGAGGAPPGATICDEYCDVITEFCTGDALQYKDREQCLAVCKLFPEGEIGGADENSIACRLKYAAKGRYAAGVELAAYCRQGGPGGDGHCGSNCDGFCTVMQGTCTEEVTDFYSYPTTEACLSDCQTLPEVPFEYGAISVADGNSVGCRLFHVISAVMADTEEHCQHARGVTLCEAPSP
jgi:hypothetical protein